MSNATAMQGGYVPIGSLDALWRCRDLEVLVPGPAGTGKTRGCLEKVNLYLMKYPKTMGVLVRKTRRSMNNTTLVCLENQVLPPCIDTRSPTRAHRDKYVYPNGSELILIGMDNPERIMSSELSIVLVSEATELNENDWEYLVTRMRSFDGPYRQMIAECNPGAPTHWLKRRADRGQMTLINSTHKDNPKYWRDGDWTKEGREYVLGTLDRQTGHRRLRLLEGKWAASEGLVYQEFNRDTHAIPSRDIPDSWRRIVSIDFGYVHPFVCQWWAIDEDGRMYLYREIYRSRRTVAEHAADILRLTGKERIEAFVSDHDAEDRATLAAAGIDTIAAMKDHRTGRDAVHARLAVQPDGRPRLFVLADCTVETDPVLYEKKRPTSTLAEFDCYAYPKGQDGRAEKEEPVKECDDGMDAMRYAAMYLDGPAQSQGGYAAVTLAGSPATRTREAEPATTAPTERTWF